jgi:uncharacterized protein (TIGR02265 family)
MAILADEARPSRSAFSPPDWSAPLDTVERLRRVPEKAIVKGMFFLSAIEIVKRKNRKGAEELCDKRYFGFKDYPLVEHIRLLETCARLAFPGESPRQGVRLLGRDAFEAFAHSMVGRAVFGIAGRSWDDAMRLVTRAYSTTGPVGTAELSESTPTRVVISFRQIWNFPDSYHVGVIEAAMQHYEKRGEIFVRQLSFSDVDMELRFTS